MAITEWVNVIDSPKNGEPANETTFERSLKQLAKRTEYLKQAVDDYSIKNGRICLFSVVVDSSVEPGDVVYYNSSTESYEKALAEGELDESTNTYSATERAFACGICVRKNDANSGDILCAGFSDLLTDWGINPRNLFDFPSAYSLNGTRGYLSSRTPGKLTSLPSSPLIQLGVFSDSLSQVWPLQKDIFESHLHYKFPLNWVPGSSQNITGTGVGKIGNEVYVDYCSSHGGSGEDMPSLLLSFKKNFESTDFSETNPCRIEIRKLTSSQKINVKIYSGLGLVKNDNASGTTLDEYLLDCPQYGEWLIIPTTGVSVAFFRADLDHINSLNEDLFGSTQIISDSHIFKTFAPQDLSGWCNVNPFDTSVDNKFRIGHEFELNLDSVWPPTPVTSIELSTNGVNRIGGVEFAGDITGIYWKKDVPPPWHWDEKYTAIDKFYEVTAEDPLQYLQVNSNISAFLYFTKSSLENSRSVVLSLGSESKMLSFVDCFSGEEASTGHLKARFNLSLNEEQTLTEGFYTTIASINPLNNKFKKGTIVSELVAGPGITITKQHNTGSVSKNVGKLRISSFNLSMEGTIDVVSLINAKEDFLNEIVPCIFFLPPSQGRCRMVSRVTVPSNNLNDVVPSLKMFAQPIGDGASGSLTSAVFSVSSFIVRSGKVIDALNLASPDFYKEFAIGFESYTARTVLDPIEIDIGQLSIGDQIYSVWEREESMVSPSVIDNYTFNCGFTQVKWQIEAV